MNFVRVADTLGRLAVMRYFPSDPGARDAIVSIVGDMAQTEEQVEWLVTRMLAIYSEWPGHMEMRACFCSRFKPADGIEALSCVYGDESGFPPDPTVERLKLAGASQRLIAGQTEASDAKVDPEFPTSVFDLLKRAKKEIPPQFGAEPGSAEEIERIKRLQEENRQESGMPRGAEAA
jgi:hypothetical protein